MELNIIPKEKRSVKNGFVIIIALIVSVIVLTVGIGIISITLKDYIFSGIVSESHKAFYASDTGLECAFYYDIQGTTFPFPTPPPVPPDTVDTFDTFPPTLSNQPIVCAGESVVPISTCNTSSSRRYCTSSFSVSANVCARAEITYNLDHNNSASLADDREWVSVRSWGYNTCDTSNPRRLERALELTYGQST